MILYIDTYISDTALSKDLNLEALIREPQVGCNAYRKQSRIDILKYSIASYSILKWTKVIIKLDGDFKKEVGELKSYIKQLFPDSKIDFTRSDTGTKYAEVLDTVRKDNPWVFFSPNNDHPFICNNPEIIGGLVNSAEKAEKKFGLPVSILYSHFTESINSISPSGYLYGYTGDFCNIIDEDEYSYTVKYDHASLISVQIFRAQHLYEMMLVAGNNRVIRAECLGRHIDYHADSIQIVPKVECCRHFDGYMHTYLVVKDYIISSRVPPLFIPDNFFEKKIKIKYGFDKYFDGFVNINPFKKSYSFNSNNGTDLAVLPDEIPACWNGRIESFEVNPEIDKLGIKENWLSMEIQNPWRDKSYGYIKLIILYRKFYFLILASAVGRGYKKFRSFLSTLKKKYYSN